MKVILCGYNWTGCSALELLLKAGHEVYVYTHDSPWYVSSLKNYAKKMKVGFSLEKIAEENLPFKPDIIASIYYRYIIKSPVIDAVEGKIFNLHPSLLPDYKGCSSVTWALINGEKEYGYTYHYIDAGTDTGNILLQKKLPIYDFDTQMSLYNRVMYAAMGDFEKVFSMVVNGDKGSVQNNEGRYYKRGCPKDGEIGDDWSDGEVERFIRAMINPPLKPAMYKDHEVTTLEQYHEIKQAEKEEKL